jgi:hypothetical protein
MSIAFKPENVLFDSTCLINRNPFNLYWAGTIDPARMYHFFYDINKTIFPLNIIRDHYFIKAIESCLNCKYFPKISLRIARDF